jgi:biopolymer transport protein TolR
MFLGKTRVEMEHLEKVLALIVTEQRRQLFLQADKAVPYGVVVEAMGRAKSAGITELGIVAERPATEAR